MAASQMVEIKDREGFRRIIRELSGGKPFKQLSFDIGCSANFLKNSIDRNKISLVSFKALCSELGISETKLLEYANKEPSQKAPPPTIEGNSFSDQITKLVALIEKQNVMIASIGEILTNMEDITEKAWK